MIEGFVRLMNAPDAMTGPVNLGNPVEITVGELARTIVEMTHSRSSIIYQVLPMDDPMQRCPDIGLARTMLDWEPKVGLETGLARTIAYFDQLLSAA